MHRYLKITKIDLTVNEVYKIDSYKESGIYIVTDSKNKSKTYTPTHDVLVAVNLDIKVVNFIASIDFLKSVSENKDIWVDPEPVVTARKETPLEAMQKMRLEPMNLTPEPKPSVSESFVLDMLSIAMHGKKAI